MSNRSEWATPDDFFDACNKRQGPFDLDAAADKLNSRCGEHYIDEEENALQVNWITAKTATPNVWLNFPWGRYNVDWVRKAHKEALKGSTTTMNCPVSTTAGWWAELWDTATELIFLRDRVAYVPPAGWIEERIAQGLPTKSSPDRDSMIARFVPNHGEHLRTPRVTLWDWKNV